MKNCKSEQISCDKYCNNRHKIFRYTSGHISLNFSNIIMIMTIIITDGQLYLSNFRGRAEK